MHKANDFTHYTLHIVLLDWRFIVHLTSYYEPGEHDNDNDDNDD